MQNRRDFLRTLTTLPLLALPTAAIAQPRRRRRRSNDGRWVKLGSTKVNDKVERDTIGVTARRGDFRAIKIRVEDRGVEFREVKVRFANGDVQDLKIRRVIGAGQESRRIDLEGRDRVIRAIEMRYDAQSLGGKKARVEVWGLG